MLPDNPRLLNDIARLTCSSGLMIICSFPAVLLQLDALPCPYCSPHSCPCYLHRNQLGPKQAVLAVHLPHDQPCHDMPHTAPALLLTLLFC